MTVDRNDMAFWFPPLVSARVRVPRTLLVHTDVDLYELLDGVTPDGYHEFIAELENAACHVGAPCFLRTGHGSGKHEWVRTCYLPSPAYLERHVAALVEWSAMAEIMGLPARTWAVRELIETRPLFHAFEGLPVTREFRLFVRGDTVEHVQPYWPAAAVAEGAPAAPAWERLLATAASLQPRTRRHLEQQAVRAVRAVGGGYWSVDFLCDVHDRWWLIDMAEGDRSFRYDP